MDLEITPEPSDAERAAIAAALQAEVQERAEPGPSAWAKTAAPVHDAHDEPHP